MEQFIKYAFKERMNDYKPNSFLGGLQGSHLERPTLLVRESVQNSFDARISDNESITFEMNGFHYSEDRLKKLSALLPISEESSEILNALYTNPFCIEVRDQETIGLVGPFHYNENKEIPETEFRNYIDFVFALGGNKEGTGMGGLFGVGKTILYLISQINTICIYSRIKENNEYHSRLILRGFSRIKTSSSNPRFNQFWLGGPRPKDFHDQETPYPFLDDEADKLAEIIGLTPYEKTKTGTSVLIISANLKTDGETTEEVFRDTIPKEIPLWFWPKMISEHEGKDKINFSLKYDNVPLPIRLPEDPDSSLFGFASAFKKLKNKNTQRTVIPIRLAYPQASLGWLSYQKLKKTMVPDREDLFGKYNLIVAYMRNVEFVVKYEKETYLGIPDDTLVFSIFHSDPKGCASGEEEGSVEEAIRISETKAHDDWNAQDVQGRQKRYINGIFRNVKNNLESLFVSEEIEGGIAVTGALATSFGKLLPIGIGSAAVPPGKGNKTSPSKNSSPSRKPFKFQEMYGIPHYLSDGTRYVTYIMCVPKKAIKKTYRAEIKIHPSDGGTILGKELVDSISIERIYYKVEGTQRDLPNDFMNIRFPLVTDYFFVFKTKENIDFTCSIIENGGNSK